MKSLERLIHKIVSPEQALKLANISRFKGDKIVFTNGCFDILHFGHLHVLGAAADMGDLLIVALNSDASVKRLKGSKRPYHSLEKRAYLLSALQIVDYVTYFEEDTPLEIIRILKPDILVKGGDWKPEQVVGNELVLAAGGKVEIIPYLEGHSSTDLLNKIESH